MIKLIEGTIYSVAVFLVDCAYGGPEEGGWWYDTGEPVLDEGFPVPFVTTDEAEAVAARDEMNKWIDDLGLNGGRYRAIITEGPVPLPYPEQRPHYE